MKVASVIERDDGGADVVLEAITAEELQILLQEGFISILDKQIKREQERSKIPAILKGDGK